MQKRVIATAVITALSLPAITMAESLSDRLNNNENRIQYLEKRISDQEKTLKDKDASAIKINGVVEVEAMTTEDSSDFALATAELGLSAKVNDSVQAEISLVYEGETTDVDVAAIHIAEPGSNLSYSLGQIYVPFGSYETNMVSSPLTLEIGEARESAIQLNYESGALASSFYLFKGTNKEDSGTANGIDNFGVQFGYTGEGFSLGAGYINDIGDSDGIQDALSTNDVVAHVAGQTINATVEMGSFTLLGEYVAATEKFDASELAFNSVGAKPSATNIELGYDFELAGKGATFAIGSQSSKEAEALELPKQRNIAALSVAIMENTSLGFEAAMDTAYDDSKSSTYTAKLAVEF